MCRARAAIHVLFEGPLEAQLLDRLVAFMAQIPLGHVELTRELGSLHARDGW